MAKVIEDPSQRDSVISARFTEVEQNCIQEAAESRGLKPSAFVRQAALSATEVMPTERAILEKLCTTEYLLTQFFAGLFTHLSDKNDVITPERFQKVRSLAPGEGRKIADEFLNPKAQPGEKSAQQSG